MANKKILWSLAFCTSPTAVDAGIGSDYGHSSGKGATWVCWKDCGPKKKLTMGIFWISVDFIVLFFFRKSVAWQINVLTFWWLKACMVGVGNRFYHLCEKSCRRGLLGTSGVLASKKAPLSGCIWCVFFKQTDVEGKDMGVSKNNGTPKSSIVIGVSIVNHPFWGFSPYFWVDTQKAKPFAIFCRIHQTCSWDFTSGPLK